MRNAKRTTLVVTIVVTLALMGGWAFAHGMWGGRGQIYSGSGYGYGWNLSPEQQEKLQAQQKKFYQDTAELQRQLYQKRLELQGLFIDPNVGPDQIKAKQREIFDLQREFQERALDHRLALRELLPEEYSGHWSCGNGPGYGHMMGYGRRHGGWHMGGGPGFNARKGFGGGPCW